MTADYFFTPNSSNIIKVEYSKRNKTLSATFIKNGETSLYNFYNVPFEVFKEFGNADSAGKYFHKNIRGKYEYEILLNRFE